MLGIYLGEDTMRIFNIAICLSLLTLISAARAAEPPRTIVTTQFTQDIANLPGKKMITLTLDMPPGSKGVPHRHAKSAFIYAYVLSGKVRSAVDDAPVKVYSPGENWFENPGAHHVVSENASATEPAKVLVVMVLDANETVLTTPDPK